MAIFKTQYIPRDKEKKEILMGGVKSQGVNNATANMSGLREQLNN